MPEFPPPATGDEDLAFWRDHIKVGRSTLTFVYVIQGALGTPVKVGLAKDPRRRLATLQTGYPWELTLVYAIPGRRDMEAALHYRLRDVHMRGEWFRGDHINDFFHWMHDFCERAKDHYWKTGELPKPPDGPPEHKPANIAHRWRMTA